MTDITRQLAEFAVATGRADMPETVWHEGRRAFVNWAGCVLGGCHEPGATVALRTLSRFAGPAQATVVGHSQRTDALTAAFVNSTSSSVHSFNDTHFATVAHPTSPVAAALLALSELQPVSGAAFIRALILGDELQIRIGSMLTTPPADIAVGLSMAGLVGGIGAAIAAGTVLGFDAPRMATAIGIAANQSAGLRQAHASMSSHFTPGQASRAGLLAAFLAQDGFTCGEAMLEGPKGFAVCFASNPNPEAALEGLGARWAIEAIAYKPYPCGFVIHPVVDACLEIVRLHQPDPDAISTIELSVNPLLPALCDRPTPTSRLAALTSCQHWAAVSLIDGAAGLAQGDTSRVQDPAVMALRARVRLLPSETINRNAALARVKLRDGRTLTARIDHCRGSEGRPMTDAELDIKFRDQALLVHDAAHVETLRTACWAQDAAPDASAIAGLIWRAGASVK